MIIDIWSMMLHTNHDVTNMQKHSLYRMFFLNWHLCVIDNVDVKIFPYQHDG